MTLFQQEQALTEAISILGSARTECHGQSHYGWLKCFDAADHLRKQHSDLCKAIDAAFMAEEAEVSA
jgi:hypothetical protein